MNTFRVQHLANRERSDLPGYAQATYAFGYDDDKFAAAHCDHGWDVADDDNIFITVHAEVVAGSDGEHAIKRFREWLATGKPRRWLTQPDFLAQETSRS